MLISIALTGFFYPRLPDQVAYHFTSGAPDRWLGRNVFVYWTSVSQAIFVFLSFAIVRSVLLVASRWSFESPMLEKLLPIMGNMLALPQLIVLFTMLDVFLYNSYQLKPIPVWVFALGVMAIGAVTLGVLLVRAARQTRRRYGSGYRE